jgi:LysM repeat protein
MMAEDFRLNRHVAETVTGTRSKGSTSLKSYLVFAGIVLLILVVGFALFIKLHKSSTADLDSIKNRLKMLEQSFPQLAGQFMELQQSVSNLNAAGESLSQRMDELSHKVAQLQKPAATEKAKSEAPVSVQTESAIQTETKYHQVQPGETLYRIAKEYGMSVAELIRLNQINTDQAIKPGQKLMVSKERSK